MQSAYPRGDPSCGELWAWPTGQCARYALCGRGHMDQEELRAEVELVAELQALNRTILDDIDAVAATSTWKLRREQIAALRERVRSMRDRHLGGHMPTATR